MQLTEILARLDSLPLTRLHLTAAFACAMGLGGDLMEMSLGNALSAVFSAAPYHMDARRISWLISAVFAGAIIGAPLLGRLADKLGLRAILIASLLWLGFTSFMAAASADYTWLIAMRLLSGLSLGALPPLLFAYLTGVAPPRYRGVYIFWTCALAFLAGPLAVFSIRWLTPIHPLGVEGWRWPFVGGGLLALGASAVFSYLPESPRWLLVAAKERAALAAGERFYRSKSLWGMNRIAISPTPVTVTVKDNAGANVGARSVLKGRRQIAFLAAIYFLQPAAALGFTVLTGPILIQRGHELSNALLYVGIATFGPSVSTLLAGAFIDRIDRREALSLCALVMLSAAVLFFTFDAAPWTMFAVVVFGLAQGFYLPLMTTYGAEMFPTQSRASATSAAWAVNRMSSFLAPIGLLPFLQRNGSDATSVLIYIPLVLSVVLLLTLGPRDVTRRCLA